MRAFLQRFGEREALLALGCIVSGLVFSILSPYFATADNLLTIARNSTELLLIGLGDDKTEFFEVLGDVIVGLLALRCIQAADEEQLLPLGGRSELILKRSRVVRTGNDGRAKGPADVRIEELEADPPLRKVRIGLGFAMDCCEVVKGSVLEIEPDPMRWSDKTTVHGRTLLVGEDCCMRGLALDIDDDVGGRRRICPAECLRL